MSGNPPTIEWYIAREGAQHGPISDVELRKFLELGHLRPTDLVWCARFTEWQTGEQAFPESFPPKSAPAVVAPTIVAPTIVAPAAATPVATAPAAVAAAPEPTAPAIAQGAAWT
jgi:hypothetical protein